MSRSAKEDREIEDVSLLTSAYRTELIQAVLPDELAVGHIGVHAVHHRPGAGVTVGYTVAVAGEGRDRYYCISTARIPDNPQGRTTRHRLPSGSQATIWQHPWDPFLPALPQACDARWVSRWLGADVQLYLMSYRPTRRAVIRVDNAEGESQYLKVVRPSELDDLTARHRILQEGGVPAPRILAQRPQGMVLLERADGEPMQNVLAPGLGANGADLLAKLIAILDKLPAKIMELPKHPPWSARPMSYAHAAATVLPECEDRAYTVAKWAEYLMAHSDPGPTVPVHGDFYEANVMVSRDADREITVRHIIDVDSLGPGHRVDDYACLLGHMSVLPHLAPQTYPHIPEDLERWTLDLEGRVDPVALGARAAVVALSLVAGAQRNDGKEWHRDAQGRLAAAEAWIARARRALGDRSR